MDAPPAPVAVWVDYRAPESCPDRAELLRRITERNARLEESSEAPPAQRYRVVIVADDRGFSGRLEQPETRAVREVSEGDCTKLVDALALVVALSATEQQSEGEVGMEEGVEATSGPSETTAPVAVPPAPEKPPNTDDPGGIAEIPLARRGHAPWLLAAGAVVLTGILREPLLGVGAGFDWAHDDGWLSLRGTGRWAFAPWAADSGKSWQLVPELCFWLPAGMFEASGCGGSAFGRVGVGGANHTWVAPLVSVGLRMPFWHEVVGELRGEADFPLERFELPASGNEPAFTTPPVTFGVSVMVGFGGAPRRGMKTARGGHGGM